MTPKEIIYNMLAEIRPEFDFETSEDFVEDGYLDSFDVVSLIPELEQTFGVIINGIDVDPDNFVSVDSILELLYKSGFTGKK